MNNFKQESEPRTGEKYRRNPDRFFHVMAEGWYVFTREGIRGPFIDRNRAMNFLHTYITDQKADKDPSAAWRL